MNFRSVPLFLLAVAFSVSCATSNKSQTAEDQALLGAVKAIGAESASAGYSDNLCGIAAPHLDYMIAQQKISHDNFSTRTSAIFKLGGSDSGEIVAYNCGYKDPAKRCAQDWDESPGHREQMRKTWDEACYKMKKGSGNCYYCIGLFANGKL